MYVCAAYPSFSVCCLCIHFYSLTLDSGTIHCLVRIVLQLSVASVGLAVSAPSPVPLRFGTPKSKSMFSRGIPSVSGMQNQTQTGHPPKTKYVSPLIPVSMYGVALVTAC